jgi:hypothetical protein
LVALAETTLAHGTAPAPGGERHQVVVHVDLATLASAADGTTDGAGAGATDGADDGATDGADDGGSQATRPEGSGRCHLDNGPALHPETVRRLACEAALLTMVRADDGSPLDVGRRTRVIPAGLRRALRERDGGCRFPGCTERRWVDGHHARHWAHGGHTNLQNLLLLCRVHHRLVHENGFGIATPTPGAFVFRRPDGCPIPETPEPTAGQPDLSGQHDATIRPSTIVPAWAGEALNLDLAVSGILSAEALARRAS